jgi:adenosine/AMP kinase
MELKAVRLEIPENGNIIVGQSHFVKTVEDLYEAMVNTVPGIKFGIAFNEASGACLTRVEGNDDALKANATSNAQSIAAGHVFVVAMRDGFPINVLGRIRDIPEVCSIFCATANPVEVIVAETAQGRGVLGVIDGSSPKGVEDASGVDWPTRSGVMTSPRHGTRWCRGASCAYGRRWAATPSRRSPVAIGCG